MKTISFAVLALIVSGAVAILAQQDTDFALLGPDLVAAQTRIGGEWNLAFCGNPKHAAERYTLSVTDELIAGELDKRLMSIHKVGLPSETTFDTGGELTFKFTRGDRFPDGHDGQIDVLTFEHQGKRLQHLEIYVTPKGRILGTYVELTPGSELPVPPSRTLVFGRRGTRESLPLFVEEAADVCGQVHALVPKNVAPVERWVGLGQQ